MNANAWHILKNSYRQWMNNLFNEIIRWYWRWMECCPKFWWIYLFCYLISNSLRSKSLYCTTTHSERIIMSCCNMIQLKNHAIPNAHHTTAYWTSSGKNLQNRVVASIKWIKYVKIWYQMMFTRQWNQ